MTEMHRHVERVRRAGRRGDTELVHMNQQELLAFEAFIGRRLRKNPRTGLKEAAPVYQSSLTNPSVFGDTQDFASNALGRSSFYTPNLATSGSSLPSGETPPIYGPGGTIIQGPTPWGEQNTGGGLGGFGTSLIQGTGGLILGLAGGAAFGGLGEGAAASTTSAGASTTTQMPPAVFDPDVTMPATVVPAATAAGGVAATTSGADSVVVPDPAPAPAPDVATNAFDLGGGLSVDQFGNVGGGVFEGGPGTAGSFDFATPGTWTDDVSSYWDKLKGLPWKGVGQGINLAGGVYGLYNANQMRNLAKNAQDPNTSYYQDQLRALQSNPNSVTSMPGYQFGMDQGRLAIQRQGAATGSGGNEAIALAKFTPAYAQQFYQQQFNNLLQLTQGGSIRDEISANVAANNALNQALWQLGWGAARMGG